ncbi:transporter substrate-binding domain-containing protein [Neorhizobium sp. NCHU2750]|uniref:transporter substrate-binding domain-containing protein n=1 Tax=Neorhizobium sp. NCHU2750 TaxID=1825976 RepID=UPI001FE1248A
MNRSHFLRIGLATLALAVALPQASFAQDKKTYVFATEGAYPPFNMTSPSGELQGFEIDLIAEVAKRGGFDYKVISQAWDGMIQGLVDGKYNGVIDAVTITDKRKEVVDFSLPYTTGGSTFAVTKDSGITLAGNGTSVDLSDKAASDAAVADLAKALSGKTVGVQVSTIQSSFLTQYLADKGVTIRTYQNGQDVYQDLTNGRIDAAMAAVTNIAAFLQKHKDDVMATGPSFKGGVMGNGSAVAVRKGDSELKPAIDKALKSMSDDGTLSTMSKKWFGLDVTPKL